MPGEGKPSTVIVPCFATARGERLDCHSAVLRDGTFFNTHPVSERKPDTTTARLAVCPIPVAPDGRLCKKNMPRGRIFSETAPKQS